MNQLGKFIIKNDIVYAPDKDSNDILDYIFDWTNFLDGDTIQTSTWTVPAGITKVTDTKTDKKATIWLSGGTNGQTYTVLNRIVTAGGRTKDKSFCIYITEL